MPELIEPDAGRHSSWLESHREWGPDFTRTVSASARTTRSTARQASPPGWTKLRSRPARLLWIVEQDVVLGGIALRPFTNDDVLRTGHIGYGIRPSARGRGLATWALAQVLPHARQAGLERALLVCMDDNAASIRTIERSGGVLDRSVDDGHGLVRRYWVSL